MPRSGPKKADREGGRKRGWTGRQRWREGGKKGGRGEEEIEGGRERRGGRKIKGREVCGGLLEASSGAE